ncbi:MAG TPA: BamA/TamA family outer membrane protein [Chitinophagaceae bacterium]|nr:BamA/TamA family outer membrane protein [Chitinophagaceae bacterium]
MGRARQHIIILLVLAFLVSCSTTRKVPEGDALYLGARVKLESTDLPARQKKELRRDLEEMTRPRPNKRLLGIPFKLLFNNSRLFRKKMGEPPVLLSSLDLDYNEKLLQNSLENRGYFHARVEGDTSVRRKKARAIYTAKTGPQYKINTVRFADDSSALQQTILESAGKTLLKTGQPFDLSLVIGERLRIDAYLKERGFYYFSPDDIIVQVDSTAGNNTVNLLIKVKPGTPQQSRNIYRINDVFIYPNYVLRGNRADTAKEQADYYKGYYVVDQRKIYKPRLFEEAMQFDPGDIYNRTDHNETISRLVNLNHFKFVKNRFEPVTRNDSTKLDVFYYLTPFAKKSLRGEINASTKSNNLTGSSITLGWRNRNTLRGGELLSIDATGGFEVQVGGQLRGFNTYRVGLEVNFNLPRFLSPFHISSKGGFVPRTNFLVAYDLLNKQKLYTMQSFRTEIGYNWKESFQKEHLLNLVSVNYVQPLLITPLYKDSAARNPTLLKAVERQFILGTTYNYNYNQLQGKPVMSQGMYFNGNIDFSGNIAGLLTGANAAGNKQKNLFNAPFAQYFRLESDARYYFKLSPTMIWANRLITGFGIPYGNSLQLPYIKQFFVGGTSSLRAFRSRSVGPGTWVDTSNTSFLPDQSGDIKLELNTELRAKLVGILHGAVFIDAGNVWLFREDSLKPGAKFSGQFLRQLAIGGGLGLRFDISFLVIRLDVAFPFRRPYPPGSEWILNDVRFRDASWRKQNIIYNLGIGYPF